MSTLGIGNLYIGMTKESIRTDIDNITTFKSEKQREQAYNKQIKLFDYANSLIPDEVDNSISEKEIEAYNKEQTRKTWKTIGLVATGVGIVLGAMFLKKGNAKKIAKDTLKQEQYLAGKVIEKSEYKNLKAIKCKVGESEELYVSAPNHLTQSRFDTKFKPQEMEVTNERMRSLHIDPDEPPNGSIAISAPLNEAISTDGLYQCAGVGFVNKSKNIQTLFHCNPHMDSRRNRAILEYILEGNKPKDLDIYIAPGFYDTTNTTIEFLIKSIKDINKKYKIHFLNFRDSKNITLILKDGKMMSGQRDNLIKTINPDGRIIYTKFSI